MGLQTGLNAEIHSSLSESPPNHLCISQMQKKDYATLKLQDLKVLLDAQLLDTIIFQKCRKRFNLIPSRFWS